MESYVGLWVMARASWVRLRVNLTRIGCPGVGSGGWRLVLMEVKVGSQESAVVKVLLGQEMGLAAISARCAPAGRSCSSSNA